MKLQLGLIGLGQAWRQRHQPALRMVQDRFQVQAVYCPVAYLAEQVAKEFSASCVDGYRALAQRPDIDAVLVLENMWLGPLPMLAACDSGKAVYWAADIDFAPDTATRLMQRVDRSGVAFMAEFPRRFAPATLRLKELIATTLGAPQLIFCHRRLPKEANALRNGERQGSVVRLVESELVGLVDWCRYVVGGEPSDVQGMIYGPEDNPSYRHMSLRFPSDILRQTPVVANISCGRYIPKLWHEAIGFRPPSAMQICCEHGVAFVDLPNTLVWFDDAGRHVETLETELPVGEQLLRQFHRAVTSLVRKMGDLHDACRALEIVRRAAESSETGRRVEC